MDLLKKVEFLINAKSRSALPRRQRKGPLEKEEAKLLADIRKALGDVAAKEEALAQRIKVEQNEAKAAASRGDEANKHAHERRAAELEYHLRQESTLAINLEEKLAVLEEKLALAQEAVEKEARKAKQRDNAAEEILQQAPTDERRDAILNTTPESRPSDRGSVDEVDVEVRKSRLSD